MYNFAANRDDCAAVGAASNASAGAATDQKMPFGHLWGVVRGHRGRWREAMEKIVTSGSNMSGWTERERDQMVFAPTLSEEN